MHALSAHYLWASCTAYHLQDLGLTALLEHTTNVVHRRFHHHKMSREVHLKKNNTLNTIVITNLLAYSHGQCTGCN